MNKGSVNIDDVQYFFPIENRDIDKPDSIVEALIEEKQILHGEATVAIQLGLNFLGAIVDVGCHIGTHTLYLASYGMHEFIGIDACKESIDCLNLSIKKNGFKNIKAVHAVASHSNFKCAFSTRTHEDSQLWQDVGFWKSLWRRKEIKRMQTQTVDEIVGDTHCGVINVDVNGYELAVLHGAQNTIVRDLPNLVVRFDPQYKHLDMILDFLHELEYTAYYVAPIDFNSPNHQLLEIREPCTHCDPTYILCFPNGYDTVNRFHIVPPTTSSSSEKESGPNQKQLLVDILTQGAVNVEVVAEKGS